MADKEKDQPQSVTVPQGTVVTVQPNVAPPPKENAGETVPGGKYVVNGRFVDANGKDLGPAKGEDKE